MPLLITSKMNFSSGILPPHTGSSYPDATLPPLLLLALLGLLLLTVVSLAVGEAGGASFAFFFTLPVGTANVGGGGISDCSGCAIVENLPKYEIVWCCVQTNEPNSVRPIT